MKQSKRLRAGHEVGLRWAALALISATLFAFGCGGDSPESGSAGMYPTGISEDIEQQLKYDARVDSFDTSGDELIVNVNDEWTSSPPGMRERTMGQWHSLWKTAHGPASKIVVKFNGTDVDTWTSEGYKPVSSKEEKASEE